MNINHEIEKLERILYLPEIMPVFSDTYVTLQYSDRSKRSINKIGTLPTTVVNTAGTSIIMYDTSAEVLRKLDWSPIYLDNKETIDNLIEQELGCSAQITIGQFRILYARPTDTIEVHRFECFYEYKRWRVYDHGKG